MKTKQKNLYIICVFFAPVSECPINMVLSLKHWHSIQSYSTDICDVMVTCGHAGKNQKLR